VSGGSEGDRAAGWPARVAAQPGCGRHGAGTAARSPWSAGPGRTRTGKGSWS